MSEEQDVVIVPIWTADATKIVLAISQPCAVARVVSLTRKLHRDIEALNRTSLQLDSINERMAPDAVDKIRNDYIDALHTALDTRDALAAMEHRSMNS